MPRDSADVRDLWLGPWRGPRPPRAAWLYAGGFTLTIHTVPQLPWMTWLNVLLMTATLRPLVQPILVGHTALANVRAATWLGVRLGLLTTACVVAPLPLRLGVAWLAPAADLASTQHIQFVGLMAATMVPLAVLGSLLTAVGHRWEPERAG